MKLLAIDTATEACSVALNLDGEIIERYTIEPRSHASQVLPMVDALLAETGVTLSNVDAIVFDRGPGSFTGIRIGTSVVQGLAFGAELPVIPVSSLEIMAQGHLGKINGTHMVAMLDARMNEIYWATFKITDDSFVMQDEEQLSAPENISLPVGQYSVVGTGWRAYQEIFKQNTSIEWIETYPDALPRAADLALLAAKPWHEQKGLEPIQAQPVYLRNNVARKKTEQK